MKVYTNYINSPNQRTYAVFSSFDIFSFGANGSSRSKNVQANLKTYKLTNSPKCSRMYKKIAKIAKGAECCAIIYEFFENIPKISLMFKKFLKCFTKLQKLLVIFKMFKHFRIFQNKIFLDCSIKIRNVLVFSEMLTHFSRIYRRCLTSFSNAPECFL